MRNISECFVRMNHDVTVYSTDPLIAVPSSRMINGVFVRTYPALAPHEAYYVPHLQMLRDLKEAQTDMMHVNNIHALTSVVAYVAHRLSHRSSLVLSPFYHGRGHTLVAQMLWMPYRPLAGTIIKSVKGIIVNSKAQRYLVTSHFGSSCRIYTVYDGVSEQEIHRAEPYDLAEKTKTLLYVGRLERYKNIHIAIAAMKHLPINYHFYVIGRGSYKSQLENLVHELNLAERVHFLGSQTDQAVYRWYRTADVFLHLSAVESFGMTCIESLAAGTPVIANEDGLGLSETIALYPDDILAYRVERDPCSRLVNLIKESVRLKPTHADISLFRWDLIAKNMENIYEQIAKK